MTSQQALDEIKRVLIKGATDGVMAVIVSEGPIFALPGLNQICRLIVNYVVTVAVNKTELGAYDIYTDLYTAKEKTDFEEAVMLRRMATSIDGKAKAEKDVIDAARKFIRFDTCAHYQ